jgi:superfamily II DNA or RNA helicase
LARLEDLREGSTVRGLVADGTVTVVQTKWFGDSALELTYKDPAGRLNNEIIYRAKEPHLEIVIDGKAWSFDADGALLRMASEAQRIRLAHLFDPLLAVHTSRIDPLPHQITAVYKEMLPRQPLRFLLADDPGAGKTIMAGLLIRQLVIRGDVQRCLIVCPGSLVEQWQDELSSRFQLPFEILTNDKLESARTGNWFQENDFAIARLDKLSRNEDVQEKLKATDWDLIVIDEAHKMSASFFGSEIKRTKRYDLGILLSRLTRHFLLMTATPHNGKEEDFQLFLALLDQDRFEGKFRDGVHVADTSDIMRRMVKERLLKFDATPLFPPRFAYTVEYALSPQEAILYNAVTEYVRNEFNRADALQNEGRKGTVGFALTTLQRRLASSPEAILRSIQRRKERLESRLRETQILQRGGALDLQANLPALDESALEDLEDAPDSEVEAMEETLVDQATAASTIAELEEEIKTLKRLEVLASDVRRSGQDRKWEELRSLLQNNPEMVQPEGSRRKLIIFTEHRDTLNYLNDRLGTLLGRQAIVQIHGGMGREERKKAQDAFTQDKLTEVLLATDAAGEGINLQRSHLVVNYDLPWNPNRIEQRFGRVHRIGQTEPCHLWNLVASETREGDVFNTILTKLAVEREALGGAVFDVLGQVFQGTQLRKLLIEAIRNGNRPEVRALMTKRIEGALDHEEIKRLLKERALGTQPMDAAMVYAIREDMERADARRLQPHHIGSFFRAAFEQLGGTMREREKGRYEITHVPIAIRNRSRLVGTTNVVQARYERVTFEKDLIAQTGKPLADFLAPGHALLDATLDIILEQYRGLLKQGAVLVDPNDHGTKPRALFYLDHSIQDGRKDRAGNRRVVSRQLQFVEIDADGNAKQAGPAPYLDYRPLTDDEHVKLMATVDSFVHNADLDGKAMAYAVQHLVPVHFNDVNARKQEMVQKTLAAVHERLTKEAQYWDWRAEELKTKEQAGKPAARLNSELARRRADDLLARLAGRKLELEQERQLSPMPPILAGGALIVPQGLIATLGGNAELDTFAKETKAIEMRGMRAVMAAEEQLGYEPKDVSASNLGYDIESAVPNSGKLRFIEVKGRVKGARDIVVTRNEILTGLNKPDGFILALVEVDGEDDTVHYIRQPFTKEPDFGATAVVYRIQDFEERWGEPA